MTDRETPGSGLPASPGQKPSPGAFDLGGFRIGAGELVLIAGPCVVESREITLRIASQLVEICARLGQPLVFKASFDKANRTSIESARGPGIEQGLAILAAVKERFGVPITTDIHLPDQAAQVAQVADLIQIPAFLCRQTDLLLAAAGTGRAVSVKKGQFLAPQAMSQVLAKLRAGGARDLLFIERGTCFGHGDLVVDFRGLQTMRALGVPVCLDATHACQRPPVEATTTGGAREHIESLARAGVAVGVDALFLETHDHPELSPSDGPNMIALSSLPSLILRLQAIHRALRSITPSHDLLP